MISPGRLCVLTLAALAVAGCVPRSVPPAPAPVPPPAPAPTPAPTPPPAPIPPPPANWQDAPLTPGDWSYRAEDGQPAASYAGLSVRCAAGGVIQLALAGRQGGALVVRTSYGERRLATGSLAAADPLLDQMAFSRGRVLVQSESASVISPSWPELARVVEDCRR